MAAFTIKEYVNITEGQTSITTSKKFVEGTLKVSESEQNSTDYSQVSMLKTGDDTADFSDPVSIAGTMVIEYTVSTNGIFNDVISNNNSNPNSIYKRYGTETKLKKNNKYTVHIETIQGVTEWSFTSETNPRYTSIKKVRKDCGDMLDGCTDEQINAIIYQNSKELQFTIDDKVRVNGAVTDTNEALRLDNAYKYWVRYKTDMDLVNAIYLSLCGEYGKSTKLIGDIQIQNDVSLPQIKNMLQRFQDLYYTYDQIVQSSSVTPLSFEKGSRQNSYSARGTF